VTEFMLLLAGWLILLAVLAAVADGHDRREARKRNQPHRLGARRWL
jgi:hypothetical protein